MRHSGHGLNGFGYHLQSGQTWSYLVPFQQSNQVIAHYQRTSLPIKKSKGLFDFSSKLIAVQRLVNQGPAFERCSKLRNVT